MSHELINRNPDLRRLVEDGYDIEIASGHLVVRRVPYVNAQRETKFGDLIDPVEIVDGHLAPPKDHTVYFAGNYPCDGDGQPIEAIRNESAEFELAQGLSASHRFSAKPKPEDRYRDFHHKMTTYARILSRYARRLDPTITATPGRLVVTEDGTDPFTYMESASSRAGISIISEALSNDRVGIIGLGGTGSYILDYVVKTRVKEIHLFDGDTFFQHNAFRSPGATSAADVEARENKADYYAKRYSQMRTVISHPMHISEDRYEELAQLDFVFIAVDKNAEKKALFSWLRQEGKAFIDVGMGLERVDNSILGVLRTTISAPGTGTTTLLDRVASAGDVDDAREYERNIQIVELNALNAALAVIRWKKHRGLYLDLEGEVQSVYTLDGNVLANSSVERP